MGLSPVPPTASPAPPAASHRHLNGRRIADPDGYVPGEAVPAEVVVYFAEDPRRVYQLRQWLPVLERLDGRHRVTLLLTHRDTYALVRAQTSLRCVLVPTWPDLADLFEASDFKVAIYVNNSVRNFQMLAARSMLHVHVNHGESDKVCMVSNQVKAYDRVFVAGEAAVRRHRAALIEFDERALVRVGRPQLDLRPEPVLPPSSRRTILYAPTWEGENSSNDYTSVALYGPAIVRAALAVPDVRVVYKPHPRVASSPTSHIAAAHAEIRAMLAADPRAGHRDETGADILAVFPGCDAMITDVSSVGLDFLYLHTDRPVFICDRHGDRERLLADAPIGRAADVVDASTIGLLTHLLARRLAVDVHRRGREALRTHYFGDLAPGESTARFLAAVTDTIADRDRALARRTVGDLGDLGDLPVVAGV
jgi:hypothetical protein